MKHDGKESHSIDTLFALLLFSTMALCALCIIVMGGRVYRNIVDDMDENFVTRTAMFYISNKVKQYDQQGFISVEEREGQNMLVLKEEIDGAIYETLIYEENGLVREMFIEKGTEVPFESGTVILETEKLHFEMVQENLLKMELDTKERETKALFLNLRSEG